MPLTPASFSIGITINPAQIVITDTSIGSDPSITDRVITLYDVNGAVFGTFDFPLSIGASITISPLTQDIALTIRVQWNDSGGNPLYTSNQIYAFTGYDEAFYYNLTQSQAGNPNIIRDNRYYNNKIALRVELDSAVNAINVGLDIAGAQGCVNRANYIVSNANLFF